MPDLKFFQRNERGGPEVWGDFVLEDSGRLGEIQGQALDLQDATVRLLTQRGGREGFDLYPETGASLDRFLGQPLDASALERMDRAATSALTVDQRFPDGTLVRSIPFGENEVRLYVVVPGAEGPAVLQPPLSFSVIKGAASTSSSPSPWVWRRGQLAIQQSSQLWRAWVGQRVVWRLSPAGLIATGSAQRSLSALGLFPEPFLAWQDAFLFCCRDARGGGQLWRPCAQAGAQGWVTEKPIALAASLPAYPGLPDGVWCDEDTDYNIAIVVGGQTCGHYLERDGQWQFRSLSLTL